MTRLALIATTLSVLLAAHASLAAEPKTSTADVAVYGGSSAGVTAAVQAARMGKRVIVVEPGRHVGGLTAGGLGMTDKGVEPTIGGLSREFYQRMYRYYQQPSAWKYANRDEYLKWLPLGWGAQRKHTDETKIQYVFEPHAAAAVYDDMLREAGVRVVFNQRLDRSRAGVRKDGSRITSIVMESGDVYAAKVFIDATYEGDLMATAGVTYATGREPNTQYGETFNGILPSGPLTFKKFSPYVIPNDPKSGLLPRIEPKPPGKPGDGDQRQQAYNFRVCLTNVPENRVPFAKPAGYNPLDYELLARWIASRKDVRPGPTKTGPVALGGPESNLGVSLQLIPNSKTDSNHGSEFGSDYLGRSWTWAEASYAEREKLWQEHKTYIAGLLWFLAYDERCPKPVREEMSKWGLAKDEFTDTDNWPFQLYVREARRMISDYVMTEHDARAERRADDAVAIASYTSDSHGVTLYLNEEGYVCREKGFFVRTGVFPVSYRAIRPKTGQADNLLVPTCLSSSHAAYGPMRMEPVFMMLGQAAGTAASLAIDEKTTVQNLSYPALRERLLADKAILDWKWPKPGSKPNGKAESDGDQ